MTKVWNWGILAPGGIATKFVKELKRVPNCRVVATASRSLERAAAFAKEFEIDRHYGSYDELVNDSEVDIIYVASPHSFHPEHAKLAMRAGKAVLCEKAVALNNRELQEMLDVAKEMNVLFMEAFVMPFQPSYIKAKEIIESGRLGNIVSINSHFSFNKSPYDMASRILNPELGGGSLLDIGIYTVFDALWFLGEPDEISASAILTDKGVDETLSARFIYRDRGAIATLFSSFYSTAGAYTELFCQQGVLRITRESIFKQKITVTCPSKNDEIYEWEEESCGMFLEGIEAVNCLEKGAKESDIVPHKFSTTLMTLLDTIRTDANIIYSGRD